jgi:glycosyltransferase involved in cell wall biosynthesis
MPADSRKTLIYVVTEDWYFWMHRLALGRAALAAGYRVIVAARLQAHGERLEAAGFTVVALPWRRRGGTLAGELRTLVRLWRLFRRERPAIVHSIALKPIIYAGPVARLARVPTRIATVAGLGYVFTSNRLKALLLRWPVVLALRLGLGGGRSAVLLENPDDGRQLARRGALRPAQIALVACCGVDTGVFVPAGTEPSAPVTVGMACRLVRGKGVDVAVDAIRRLRAAAVPIRFRLAGGLDPDSADSHSAAELQGWIAEGVVEWLGHIDDVAGFWRSVHLALYPSSYGEGVPRTLLEAAATGLPVVTTDMPGCREAVVDGVTGYLVPPNDPAAVAARLRLLVEDPARRGAFGRAARARAEAEFADPVVVGRMLDAYRRAAS